jgi:hypothetical protein
MPDDKAEIQRLLALLERADQRIAALTTQLKARENHTQSRFNLGLLAGIALMLAWHFLGQLMGWSLRSCVYEHRRDSGGSPPQPTPCS